MCLVRGQGEKKAGAPGKVLYTSSFSCYKESPFCPKYLAPLLPPAIPSLYLSLWDSPGSLAAGKGQVGGQEDSTGQKERK